jgi:hypothetical protein
LFVPNFRSIFTFVLAACSMQAASVSISPIFVSIGPDNYSPNYAAYTANAQSGVSGGGTNVGGNIQTDPTAFNVVSSSASLSVNEASVFVTPFPLWLGVADPSGAVSSEYGNLLFWSVLVSGGPGNNISLDQLSVTQSSTDPEDYFGDPSQPAGVATALYSGYNYSSDLVGIQADGTKITSGSSSQLVNSIVFTGFGDAFDGYGYNFPGTDAQQFQQINDVYVAALGSFSINTCISYGAPTPGSSSSCDVVNILVPEPSAIGTVSVGLSLLPTAWFGRRKRQRLGI